MDDAGYMRRALGLAELGRGWVEPNPVVGAVLVRDGEVVGEGYHRKFGGAHAEVEALADARSRGVDPRGLTLYVTLEPCAHVGKTGPCADAVIGAGVARVVVAMIDPYEEVAGRGVARLREAGVRVEVGLLGDEARRLNEPFLKRVATGGELPWVIAKWAQTLDGKIATSTGDSRWISGEGSRLRVHELRARVDAIVVGVGTVAADDPALTARGVEVRRVARRVVVDPRLRIPPDARLLGDGPPVLLAAEESAVDASGPLVLAWRERGIEVLPLTAWRGDALDLRPLLRHLAVEHGATNVLVEGGAGLIGTLLEQELIDRLLVYVAPKVLGDPAGLDPVRGGARERIADGRALELVGHERVGDDVELDYRVVRG